MDPQRPEPEERGLLLLVSGAAVIAVLAALGWWWLGRPQPMDLDPALDSTSTVTTPPVAASGSPAPPAPSGSTSAATLVVDIRGAVRAPGLRQLPPGSRVADAIDALPGDWSPVTDTGRSTWPGRWWTGNRSWSVGPVHRRRAARRAA
ncbi:MAG: hypothetical protein U0R64_03715 [Candidatus Nanopelagicales bacterium]